MQKKSNVLYMKQNQLIWALNECLEKILQILEVTLNKLVLRMDEEASNRNNLKFREIQNQTDISTIHIRGSGKKQKFALDAEQDAEGEDHGISVAERFFLTHAIIDLLNTIEAGSKTTVIRTTEVWKEIFDYKLINLLYKYHPQIGFKISGFKC